MVIQYNMQAMFNKRNMKVNVKNNSKTTERLSSGYRINRSADDAAGLSISEKMRWYIRGLNRDVKNIQDGISLIQVADGALSEVHSMLQRMNELSVQAANDSNTDFDRQAIQNEIYNIKQDINRISTDTVFNDDIVIFKPTNIPQIHGRPTDILVYHEDYNAGVREGGIIYNGRRYKYVSSSQQAGDYSFVVNMDSNGNIKKGIYTLKAEGENNKGVDIDFIFDGGNRTPSARKYELDPRDEGIYIDEILHPWNTIKNKNGSALDPDNLQAGTYSFVHAGMTITFEVKNGLDFLSLLDELKADGLDTYTLQSGDVSSPPFQINPSIGMTDAVITADKRNYIPGNNSLNYESQGYRMRADETGVYMYIDSSDSNGQGEVRLDKMTWEQIGLTEWFRGNNGIINPSSTVTGGEKNNSYRYYDSKTDTTITFTVDSEVSQGELIKAINAWHINVKTNNEMIFTANSSGSGTTISIGSHSSNLDAYGTQYGMGRDMSKGKALVLQKGMKLNYNSAGDELSFTMEDANNKEYTFSSSNVKNNVSSDVGSDLNSYISNYKRAYESYLNSHNGNGNGFSYSGNSNYNNNISFNDAANGYSVNVNYTNSFDGWLNTNNFDIKKNEVNTGYPPPYDKRIEYTVVLKSNNNLNSKKDKLVNDIYNALKNTSISAKTDDKQLMATTTISSPITTRNTHYSSQTITGDRKVKIQSGPLSGQYIEILLPAMNTATLKIGGVDVTTSQGADSAIDSIRRGINIVSDMRSKFGATQNRLEHARTVNQINSENTQAAESTLRDADMAKEMVELAKNNIILQIEQSIFAQDNDSSRSMLLELLQY